MTAYTVPELLAPAGSPEALEAALTAGADAVYLGGAHFNARMNARNFDAGELREAVAAAHRLGGRVYLTLNTLLWDRELPASVTAAYEAASAGVDALIIADMGASALIRRALPELPLHASTQMSGHNAHVGEVLAPFGFSRFVIARETALPDLAAAVRSSPLEVEVFVHGALCVSHSGQCLFSSVVGGRSGNRGECAQPCRLPYACGAGGSREGYPLSLKDLTLASHVPALIDAGVASLKIEGRMKSAGYVSGVVAIWRRLLDERRAATREEIDRLSALFSRNGFTDGYQTGRVDHGMMGVRSDADKEKTAAAERDALAVRHAPHLPLSATLSVHADKPVRLTGTAPLYRQGGESDAPVTVTVEGEPPLTADGQALTHETAERQLCRTGGTPYRLTTLDVESDGGLSVPASRLNALRRDLVAALDAKRLAAMPRPDAGYTPLDETDVRRFLDEALALAPLGDSGARRTARFRSSTQITPCAIDCFDILFLPLGADFPPSVPAEKRGYILPPVIFDRDADAAREALSAAVESGIRHVMPGNLGHLPLVREVCDGSDVSLHGDLRLGVTNAPALARVLAEGLTDVILSPELTLPRMRDTVRTLGRPWAASVVVYGRLPLMLLEKCAIREIYSDRDPAAVCREICHTDRAALTDRMGKRFPVLREDFPGGQGHRNVVYNSLPLCMSDRRHELEQPGEVAWHFIFSTESATEVDAVLAAYRDGRPLGTEVRRMMR